MDFEFSELIFKLFMCRGSRMVYRERLCRLPEKNINQNVETKRPERVCILREINITIFSLWQFASYQSIVSLSLSLVVLFI